MKPKKQPKLSRGRRQQVVDLWPRISAGEIVNIDQALDAIPIKPGDPEYVIVRAVLSLFLERGPTLVGNFDIYTEMAYIFADVILESTPPEVISLMHVAAIPPHFNLRLLAYLTSRPEKEIEPVFDQLVECRVIRSDSAGNYWFPPTFRDCLLLHWFRPENQAGYARIEERMCLWEHRATRRSTSSEAVRMPAGGQPVPGRAIGASLP